MPPSGLSPSYAWAPDGATSRAGALAVGSGGPGKSASRAAAAGSIVATDEPIMATVAGRYASALFELANDERRLDAVEKDINALAGMLAGSADLMRMVRSPVISAEDQGKAIAAIAASAGFADLTTSFLRLLARSRRMFVLSDIVKIFRQIAARHRGEITAEVVSAHALNEGQRAALEDALKGTAAGRHVRIETRVDPAILGGLVVKMGSRMIDSSLRTKLNSLSTRMKEVR
jgi:F-type H+-transporting ATPase subunit delta